MVARASRTAKVAGGPPARGRAGSLGAPAKPEVAGRGFEPAPVNGDATAGPAAHRWGRRIIAWALRRSAKLARRGCTPQALRIVRRMAAIAPACP